MTFNPIINNNQTTGQHSAALSLVARMLFAFVILSSALLFEKFSIQWIAGKFHERSYAERIADQKAAVRVLVTLYAHSSDVPGEEIHNMIPQVRREKGVWMRLVFSRRPEGRPKYREDDDHRVRKRCV